MAAESGRAAVDVGVALRRRDAPEDAGEGTLVEHVELVEERLVEEPRRWSRARSENGSRLNTCLPPVWLDEKIGFFKYPNDKYPEHVCTFQS